MSTEPSPTNAAVADAPADITHRAAADKFFAAPPADAEPSAPPADKPADKAAPPADKPAAQTAPDPLAAILKGAQKAAPAAAAEPAPLDDIDKGLQAPPDNAKSRAGWDELKKRANEERKLRLELEQKLKSTPATTTVDEATKARLAELETQNKQYSERLKVFDLKNHPEFVSKFVQPAEQAKAAMDSIAKTDEVEVDVNEMLSLKGKALNNAVSEAMERMTPYARVRFQAALDSYFSTQAGAEQALKQADETLKTFKNTNGARSRASFDDVAKAYTGTFLPAQVDEKAADTDKAAVAAYNDALGKITTQAEQYAFGAIDERGAADLAHKAALYEFTMSHGIPRIASAYNSALSARDAKIAELEKQVKALTVASPSLSGGAGAPSGGDTPPANETHLQAAGRYFGR